MEGAQTQLGIAGGRGAVLGSPGGLCCGRVPQLRDTGSEQKGLPSTLLPLCPSMHFQSDKREFKPRLCLTSRVTLAKSLPHLGHICNICDEP